MNYNSRNADRNRKYRTCEYDMILYYPLFILLLFTPNCVSVVQKKYKPYMIRHSGFVQTWVQLLDANIVQIFFCFLTQLSYL